MAHTRNTLFLTQARRFHAAEVTREYDAHVLAGLGAESGQTAETWKQPAPMRATCASRRAGLKAWLRNLIIYFVGH